MTVVSFDLLATQRAVFKSSLRPIEKLVALALLDHWSRTEGSPFPSVGRLSQWTSLGRRTVVRAIGGLEAAGVLLVSRRTGRSSRYELGRLSATSVSGRDLDQGDTGPSATGAPDPCQSGTGARAALVPERHTTNARAARVPVPERHPKEPREGTKRRNQENARAPALALSPDLSNRKPATASAARLQPVAPAEARGNVVVGSSWSGSRQLERKPKAKSRKGEAAAADPTANKLVVEAYFVAFEAKHGRKPTFDGAAGAAVNSLLAKLGGDASEASRRIVNAFASWRGNGVTIRDIASNPDSFVALEMSRGAVPVPQRGAYNSQFIDDAKARGLRLVKGEGAL